MTTHIKFRRIHGFAEPPRRSYRHDAGFDLITVEPVTIPPMEGMDIKTGIVAAIPDGFWGLIIGRSSTLRDRRLMVMPGIIDSGFRGELFVHAMNLNAQGSAVVDIGDRIGQIIIVPVPDPLEWTEAMALPEGERGLRGFGSTGR